METQTGTCRFCGQMKTIRTAELWTQEDVDEHVTRACSCYEAREYDRRMKAKENAEKAVENLFGEESKLVKQFEVELDEDLKRFLLEMIELISEGKLFSCSIDEGRVKIRVAVTGSGVIKLKCTYKHSEEDKA